MFREQTRSLLFDLDTVWLIPRILDFGALASG